MVGAGINTRDYVTRVPLPVEAGADVCASTHLGLLRVKRTRVGSVRLTIPVRLAQVTL